MQQAPKKIPASPDVTSIPSTRLAPTIALGALVLGGLWVLLTNRVVHHFAGTGALAEQIDLWKEAFFALAVAMVSWWAVRAYYRRAQEWAQALRDSETQARLAMEAAQIGSFDWDIVAGKIVWSPIHQHLWGYRAGEFGGTYEAFRERVHPDDIAQVEADIKKGMERQTPYRHEFRVIWPDGSIHWISGLGQCDFDANGKPVRMRGTVTEVTERKLVQLELVESELRRGLALTAANMGTWDWDVRRGKITWSDQHEALWGYAPGTFPGTPEGFTSRVHPEDLPRIWAEGDLAHRENRPMHCEYRVVRPDGTIRWVCSHGRQIFSPEGERLRMLGVVYDITDHKTAEAAREADRLQLQVAMNAAQMGSWHFDFTTNQLTWSDELFKVFGLPKQEVSLEYLRGLIHEADRELLDQKMEYAIATRSPYKAEFRIIVGDRMYWVDDRGEVDFAPDGRPLRAFGVALDITERKQTEEAQLRSEAEFRAMFEVAAIGVAQADPQTGRFLRVNQKLSEITGYSPAELLERGVPDITHPEDRSRDWNLFEKVVRGELPSYRTEKRYVRKDGGIVWVNINMTVVRDSTGQPYRTMATIEDITERRQAAEKLEQAHARTTALAELSRALAEVSTPRAAALSILDTARKLIGWDSSWLREWDEETQRWQSLAAYDLVDGECREVAIDDAPMARPAPLIREAMIEPQMLLRQSENEAAQPLVVFGNNRRSLSLMFVPMRASGRLIGMLSIQSYQKNFYDAADLQLLHALADDCAGAVERTRAQAELRRREEIYYSIISQAVDAIALVDAATARFIEFNTAAHEGLGYSREEFAQLGIQDIEAEHSPEGIREHIERVQAQDSLVFETRHRHRDGSLREVRVSTRLLKLAGQICIACMWTDITKSKQAAAQLARSERLLRESQETAQIGHYVYHMATGLWESSPVLDRIFGIAPEFQHDSEGWARLVCPADREKALKYFQTILEARKPFRMDYRILRPKDGQLRWMAAYGDYEYDDAGNAIRLVGCIQDITDRKLAEESLAENEERLRLALKAAAQGLYDLNVQTGETMVSPEYATMLGYDPTTFRETNPDWAARLHPDDRAGAYAAYENYINGKSQNYSVEFRQRTRAGDWKWILSIGKIVSYDTTGRPLRMLGTHTDITERKNAEARLHQQEADLLTAQETAHIGSWAHDLKTDALMWSDEMYRIFEIDRTANGPTPEAFLNRVHPEDRERVKQDYEAALANRTQSVIQHRLLFPDGRVKYVQEHGTCTFDADGQLARTYGTVQDITAHKLAERLSAREANRNELLLELHQRAPQLQDKELFDYVLDKAVKLTDSAIGFFHQVSDNQNEIILTTWNQEALKNCTAAFDNHYPLREAGNWVDCVREQRPVVYNDFANSPHQRGLPAGHAVLRRFMSIPVIKDDKVRIIFGVGNKEEDYDDFDKSQLQLVANELHKIMLQREAQHQVRQLSLAVEQSPTSIMITDVNGTIEYVNPRFETITGFKMEEVRGRTPRLLKSGLTPPTTYENLWQTILRGDSWQGELVNRRKNGELYWELMAVSPLRDASGRTTHFVSVKEDITQRKRLESLREALLTLGAQLNGTNDAPSAGRALLAAADQLWQWDSATLHVFTPNQERARCVLAVDVLAGVRQELAVDYEVALSPRMLRVMKSGAELILRDQDAALASDSEPFGDTNRLSAAIMCVPVRRESKPVGVLSIQSYTYKAFSAEDLKIIQALADYCGGALDRIQSEEALRGSEQRYRNLVETSFDWIWEVDAQGRYTYASPKITSLLGYRPEEVLGKTPFEMMPAEEAARVGQIFRKYLERKTSFSALENTNRHKDGRLVVLETSGVPILDAKGELQGYRGMDRDITERKRLEDQLRQTQKLEAIGQLAGGVAHDFNNILAAIMMQLSLLQSTPELSSDMRQGLNEVDASARRAAGLTRQLLMFSRRSVLNVKPLDLNEIIANLLKMLGRLIGEQIDLRFDGKNNLPPVEADAGMLEQVLMNLVVNARDAMPKGGRITISTQQQEFTPTTALLHNNRRPGKFLCLEVTDTGTGMDASTRKRIFEPFFTTKEAGKGTGLGLATVHGITAQHKGWVEVESELGFGATFRVYLPAMEQPTASATATVRSETLPRGTETILLVEDDISVRRLVGQVLRKLGYLVHEADNGQQALKLWQLHGGKVDLLLTDMVMPEGMTGLELTEHLQALKPGLKAIISSGYSTEIALAGVPNKAGLTYLPKPYVTKVLANTIRQCLDRKPNAVGST